MPICFVYFFFCHISFVSNHSTSCNAKWDEINIFEHENSLIRYYISHQTAPHRRFFLVKTFGHLQINNNNIEEKKIHFAQMTLPSRSNEKCCTRNPWKPKFFGKRNTTQKRKQKSSHREKSEPLHSLTLPPTLSPSLFSSYLSTFLIVDAPCCFTNYFALYSEFTSLLRF